MIAILMVFLFSLLISFIASGSMAQSKKQRANLRCSRLSFPRDLLDAEPTDRFVALGYIKSQAAW